MGAARVRKVQSFSSAIVFVICALAAAPAALSADEPKPRKAVPIDPVAGILAAFGTHDVVAIGDGVFHGDTKTQEFLMSMIREPRFAATVDDIVLEAYNSLYQDAVDRFVAGREVPHIELQKSWQDSTQVAPGVDAPFRGDILQVVRSVNASAPADHQLRVLLADPPVDWASIRTKEDLLRSVRLRATFPAELVLREVLDKHRRALIVFGMIHLQRKDIFQNFAEESQILLPNLERIGKRRVFNVWIAADLDKLQADIAAWSVPSLTMIRGTTLGAALFTHYYPHEVNRIRLGPSGENVPIPKEQWRASPRMEEQFDAILHMGSLSSITRYKLPREKCDDPEWRRMRLGRMQLIDYPDAEAVLRRSCEQ
jgi:hypothetical protein